MHAIFSAEKRTGVSEVRRFRERVGGGPGVGSLVGHAARRGCQGPQPRTPCTHACTVRPTRVAFTSNRAIYRLGSAGRALSPEGAI